MFAYCGCGGNISIKAGKPLPSTILRRLGSYSRHKRLYQAFRERGLVVRTEFLLRYLSDLDLRRIIQVAMNKSERFNKFQPLDVIAEFAGKSGGKFYVNLDPYNVPKLVSEIGQG